MEGVLFIIIVFGGGMLFALSKTEIGHALAERIRGHGAVAPQDPVMLDEMDRLRQEVAELHERMDFAERLLANKREADQSGSN
jgi:hypothetical protein